MPESPLSWVDELEDSAPSLRATPDDPLIGRVLNHRYQLVEVIAVGRTTKVFRAEQSPVGRICAVKILSPDPSDKLRQFSLAERFTLEARTVSRLSHPNIVVILDVGRTTDGLPYMVLEHIPGVTLRQALEAFGPVDEERAAGIGMQIAAGLHHAHQQGIIHRNLTPNNVLLCTRCGTANFVKLIDFSQAKAIQQEEDEELTTPGVVLGTPEYMSPEQIAGETLDARADVYSLGVLLFELISGFPPFRGDNYMDVLLQQRDATPPALSECTCSPAFGRLIRKCLEKNPEDRFASMGELMDELECVVTHGGAAENPVRRLARGFRQFRWRRWYVEMLLVVIVATLFLAMPLAPAELPVEATSTVEELPVLLVTTDPPGAFVRINGNRGSTQCGSTPCSFPLTNLLDSRRLVVNVTKPGYYPDTQVISVTQPTFHVQLRPREPRPVEAPL